MVDVNVGAKEMSIRDCFKLDGFSVKPFVHELSEGRVVEYGFGNYGKPVVNISFVPHGFGVVRNPNLVVRFPFTFSEEYGN